MRRSLFATALLLAVSAAPAFAVDRFANGSNAYSTGFYGAAARHWMDLAEKGHGPAQYNVGRMFYYGQGVARDPVEAYKWFLLANDSGVERSRTAAEMLGDRLTSRQIAEATIRAREWGYRNTRSH